jgi:hypothetical protein
VHWNPDKVTRLKAVSIDVRFARAGEAFIVFDGRHARESRFSKPAPPARAKRLQWKSTFRRTPATHPSARIIGFFSFSLIKYFRFFLINYLIASDWGRDS